MTSDASVALCQTVSSSPSPIQQREEEVLVLYGSQTGNSEQAAKELSAQMRTKLTPLLSETKDSNNGIAITVTPKLMQLDDFLELEQAKWTRLVVIIVSSYGIGQAPLGARRFREFIDYLIETYSTDVDSNTSSVTTTNEESDTKPQNNSDNGDHSSSTLPSLQRRRLLLEGVSFALCGLGDSKFPTFFQNPTAIWRGLQLAGAVHVGPLGKADASSGNDMEVIQEWRDVIWPHLAQVIAVPPEPTQDARLLQMQKETVEICYRLNPDMQTLQRQRQQKEQPPQSSSSLSSMPLWIMISAVVVVLLAIAVIYVKV